MKLFQPVRDVSADRRGPYCGPSAVALLTGVPVSRIEKMFRRIRGGWRDELGRRKVVKGTYASEVLKVLKRLGCRVEPYTPTVSTFGRFVDDTRHVAGAFLVEVTGHWMTTSGGFVGDSNNMYDGPQPLETYGRQTRRVVRAWRVFAPALPMYTVEDRITAAPRERKPRKDIRVVRARKLAAQVKAWETKKKRAETALKKLRPKLRRYEKLGIAPTE